MKKTTMVLVLGISAFLLGATPDAEQVWVKEDAVHIRAGKGAVYPILAMAKKGTKLVVLDHERKWLKVQLDDKQGYIYEDDVSDKSVGGDSPMLAFVKPDDQSSVLSAGSATRGLQGDTEAYVKNSNTAQGRREFAKLLLDRGTIQPEVWEAFTARGKVGPDAPSH
jgi:uncharacterized protein YgiM (DUF1202 family)